jgi:hypothetical protein
MVVHHPSGIQCDRARQWLRIGVSLVRGVHDGDTRGGRVAEDSFKLLPRISIKGGVRFIK